MSEIGEVQEQMKADMKAIKDDAILPPKGHLIEDSKKIGPEMQEKALGFS